MSSVRNNAVCPSVPTLIKVGGPTTVFGLVVPVVVDSLKRMSRRRARSHVLQERFVRIPPFTDTNAASAVVVEKSTTRAVAPISHVSPCAVLGREVSIRLRQRHPRALQLRLQTSAGSRSAFKERLLGDSTLRTAIASNNPGTMSPCVHSRTSRQHNKSFESAPNHTRKPSLVFAWVKQ